MNKQLLITVFVVLALVAFIGIKVFKKSDLSPKNQVTQVEEKVYWTCPMHPQINQNHPGECPICHMKLVKVSDKKKSQTTNEKGEQRNEVHASQHQLELIGIGRQEVEKMSLHGVIPVSGRILNSSSVAFQIYESDLKYVRPGLTFQGEDSFSQNEVSGVVSSVDSIVDPTSRTVRVIGSIRKAPARLLAESSFSGTLSVELKDRVAIPESSVLHTGSNDLVYIFSESNKLTPKPVQLGMKAEGFYEVLEGLQPGDVISSGPNFLIDSEAKIRGAGSGQAHH